MSWWKFWEKDPEAQAAEQQFKDMLREATINTDDLESAVEQMRKEREKRNRTSTHDLQPG